MVETPARVIPLWSPAAKRALFVVLALAAALRLGWLVTIPTQPVTDFDWYVLRAVAIARGEGYSVNGIPTAYWPVGYSGALSLIFRFTGESIPVAKALNLLLILLSLGLSARLAARLFRRADVGILTAALLSLHPAWIAYTGILASEPLYTALTLSAFLALDHLRRNPSPSPSLWSGLLIGLATLVRPQAILLALLAPLAQRSRPHLGWFIAALTLALLPWHVRNQLTFGQFVFVSTNGGDNLLISAKGTGRYTPPLGLLPADLTETEPQRDKRARSIALETIRTNPAAWFALAPEKLNQSFLSGTDSPYWAFQIERGRLIDPGRTPYRPHFLAFRTYSTAFPRVFLVLSGLGLLILLARRQTAGLALPLTVIAYTAGLAILFFGNPRFGFPAHPFIAMIAAAGALSLWPIAKSTPDPQESSPPQEAASLTSDSADPDLTASQSPSNTP